MPDPTIIDIHRHLGPGDDENGLFVVPEREAFGAWLDAHTPPPGPPGILTAPAYYAYPAGVEDADRLNALLSAVCQRWPKRFLGFCGTVEPHFGEAGLDVIDRLAALPGAGGVVWRPRASGVFSDAVPIVTCAERAAGHGLVPMVHALPTSGNEALWRTWHLAESLPGIRIVALGALATWDQVEQVAAFPDRAPNLLYDTTDLDHGTASLGRVVRALGADRVLYGTGALTPRDAAALATGHETFSDAGLTDDEVERVLWRNAAELFRLPQVVTQ